MGINSLLNSKGEAKTMKSPQYKGINNIINSLLIFFLYDAPKENLTSRRKQITYQKFIKTWKID